MFINDINFLMTNSVNQIFEGHCRHRRQNIYEQAEVFKCHERDVHKQCSRKQKTLSYFISNTIEQNTKIRRYLINDLIHF